MILYSSFSTIVTIPELFQKGKQINKRSIQFYNPYIYKGTNPRSKAALYRFWKISRILYNYINILICKIKINYYQTESFPRSFGPGRARSSCTPLRSFQAVRSPVQIYPLRRRIQVKSDPSQQCQSGPSRTGSTVQSRPNQQDISALCPFLLFFAHF